MRFSDRLATDNALTLVRSTARLVFAVITFMYLYPAGSTGAAVVALVLLGAYLGLQGLLVWRGGMLAEVGGIAVDLAAIAIAVTLDPSPMPPTLLMFLVLILSGGLLHGPKRFNLLLALSALTIAALISFGGRHVDANLPAMWFAGTIMLACAIYAGILLYRNQAHERLAREATWRDPQTGLISHQALISTAGWLLPLHDRMAANLTLVLLKHGPDQNLPTLSEKLSQRLRRSDVAARYGAQTLALMLPCTTVTAAENLLGDLRQQGSDFRAALIAVSSSEHSLEAVLQHLEQHLHRASEQSGHWIVHAPSL
ncbi:MAG: GGDEF domain-containing protein [Alcanivoracaceae bacterium]